MSKLIPMVWDSAEFWEEPCPSYLSFPANHNGILIPRPVDNPEEAARLYKENHNSARANGEWAWLDKTCSVVYNKYCKLWDKVWKWN